METFVVYGLGGWWLDAPWFRLPATGLLLGLAAIGAWRLARHESGRLALLWTGSYVICTLLNYDVDLTRYSFPLVAMACILVGIGLPANRNLNYVALAGLLTALGVVTVPLALEHHDRLPLAPQLAAYANSKLDPALSVVLITDDTPVSTLRFFMPETAPAVQTLLIRKQDMEKEVLDLERQERLVYSVWLPASAPQDWPPVARFCRSRFLESRGPLEVWLYRHTQEQSKLILPPAVEWCSN